MNDNHFKVSYSVADPEALKAELVKRYGFKKPVGCWIFKCGVSDVYLVRTDNTVYYLRIANNGITGFNLIDYKEEADIMVALNESGVNTAVPVRCDDGEFVWPVNAPEDYTFIYNSMKQLSGYISDRLPTEKPYYGFCHGDVQMMNVFFQGETPTFFDFDCMGYGWRSHDVSVYVLNAELGNPQFRESDEYKAYIDGYNSIRRLSENEIACINAFGAIRAIWVIGLNIMGLEKTGGIFHIDGLVNEFARIFRTWYEKVYPKRD
jgi:Ser/Thr protein kinase RdoA (MazF antagonist)